METISNCLFVGAGGMFGAIARYLMGLLPLRLQNGFPLITLGINLLGAFCIGLIAAQAGKNPSIDPRLLLLLKVGICGGFTTFSTFSLEALTLLQSGKYLVGLSYMILSTALCVAAAAAAQILVK